MAAIMSGRSIKGTEVILMLGHDIRFSRFLKDGENTVVVALDHGVCAGPNAGNWDLPGVVGKFTEADGLLLSSGMAETCRDAFLGRGAPALLLRLTWFSPYAPWGYDGSYEAMVLSPGEAAAMGADAALASCNLKSGDERTDTENVKLFSEIVRGKRACGLPVLGEYYPANGDTAPREEIHDDVVNVARILSELGADGVKTFYTGKKFRQAVTAASVPVLVLGSGKMTEPKALQQAYDAVNDGARGVFYGRNVTLANDPKKFLSALIKVVKKGIEPSTAMREVDL